MSDHIIEEFFKFANAPKDLNWMKETFIINEEILDGELEPSRDISYRWWQHLRVYLASDFITTENVKEWEWEFWPEGEERVKKIEMSQDEKDQLEQVKEQLSSTHSEEMLPPSETMTDSPPVTEIKGIGPKAAEELSAVGVHTIEDLENLDVEIHPEFSRFKDKL